MSFYITLPSNVHASNSPSHYRVTLSRPINLDGSWEVALNEITILRTIKTIHQESLEVLLNREDVEKYTQKHIKNKIPSDTVVKADARVAAKTAWRGKGFRIQYRPRKWYMK